jgi:hypothetical protein
LVKICDAVKFNSVLVFPFKRPKPRQALTCNYAIAWVVDQLNLNLEVWEERKARAVELHDKVILWRKTQLEQIKRTLIHLHKVGLINDRNIGKEREIEIRDNPPKVANLLVEVDDEDFPDEFRTIKYQANNKAILEAYKSGNTNLI